MITLLHAPEAKRSTHSIKNLLDILGVRSFREIDVEDLKDLKTLSLGNSSNHELNTTTLIAPFYCLESLFSVDQNSGSISLRLPKSVNKVFFHSLKSIQNCERVLQALLVDPEVRLKQMSSRHANFFFSDSYRDICGPLSGLCIQSDEEIDCRGVVFKSKLSNHVDFLIKLDSSGVLIRIRKYGLDIFMLFTSHFADPDHIVETNLDVNKYVLSLVAPIVVLKYLSRGLGWSASNNYANLIIDDPPLSLQYGYIDFKRVYDLAVEHDMSMTLAYIPCYYRRGTKESIKFFKKASDRISFCIHGCNHTKSEFGVTDITRINELTSLASCRMNSFSEQTGIPHTKIMVFPQGVFSSDSIDALKKYNFNAAVNTELKDMAGKYHITIKDILQPAIICYGGFPLFLRRNISDGISNIAFDLLLGKPSLIVAHHQDFASNTSPLWQLVETINKLTNPPKWKSLQEIVARSALVRTSGNKAIEMKIYSRVADLKAISTVLTMDCLRVIKDENDPERIKSILLGRQPTEWVFKDGKIIVDIGKHSEVSELSVVYCQDEIIELPTLRLNYNMGVWFRRKLCEFRDNYVSKSSFLKKISQIRK